jgi:ribonuclease HI
MYVLYTDGSCLGNPGRGGWAARCVDLFDISGGTEHSTNNIMEMTAVVKGLEKCLEHGLTDVIVYTDSVYVMKGMNVWIHGWKNKGWKTAGGTPVKNKELWIRLDELREKFNTVEMHWVKAHAGNTHNEFVDSEARRQALMI